MVVALRPGAHPGAGRSTIEAAGGAASSPLPAAAWLAALPPEGKAAVEADPGETREGERWRARVVGGGAGGICRSNRPDPLPPLQTPPSAASDVSWVGPYDAAYKVAPEWAPVLAWAVEAAATPGGGPPRPPPPAAAPYARPGPNGTWTVDAVLSFPAFLPDSPVGEDPFPAYAPAAAALDAWGPALGALCEALAGGAPCPASASPGPSGRLAVTLPLAALGTAVPWLAAAPATAWVAPRARARVGNFFASGVCQVGEGGRGRGRVGVERARRKVTPAALNPARPALPSQAGAAGQADVGSGATWGAAGTTPLWDAGLRARGKGRGVWWGRAARPWRCTHPPVPPWVARPNPPSILHQPTLHPRPQGSGQVLGMGDTGLDADHCAFRDPAVPGPGAPRAAAPAVDGTGTMYWESVSHRKLRRGGGEGGGGVRTAAGKAGAAAPTRPSRPL